MKKTAISIALAGAALGFASTNASAALATDALLSMGPQSETCPYGLGTPPDCVAGDPIPQSNYFAMDTDGDGIHQEDERTAISAGSDGGVLLGVAQNAHTGQIDAPWVFFGPVGEHATDVGPTILSDDGAGNATLDFSGWRVFWNNTNINMGSGGTSNGVATLTCGTDCGLGDSFVLDYDATVPDDGSTNFGNVYYAFHIEGTISEVAAIPVPAAVWLFGSGLLGLVGVARRKKA